MTETQNTSDNENNETPKPVLTLQAGMGSPGFGFLVATPNEVTIWSRSEQQNMSASIGEFRVTETGEVFLRVYYKNDPQRRFKLLRKEEVEEQNGCTIEILMSEDFPQCNALAQTGAVQAVPVQEVASDEQVSQHLLASVWNRVRRLFGGR